MLWGITSALDVRAKYVEVVSKSEGFEGLIEGYFGPSYNLHSHFIVEIDVIVLFLDNVGIVVWIEIDGFDSSKYYLNFWG